MSDMVFMSAIVSTKPQDIVDGKHDLARYPIPGPTVAYV